MIRAFTDWKWMVSRTAYRRPPNLRVPTDAIDLAFLLLNRSLA